MKKLAPIGLLVLLVYHILGPSIAALSFGRDYRFSENVPGPTESVVIKMYLPELPYTLDLQAPEQINALIRQGDQFYNPTHIAHEGDTLYVTLTSNQAARDRFFELAGAMERLSKPEQDRNGGMHGKLAKLFSGLLKNYIPVGQDYQFNQAFIVAKSDFVAFRSLSRHYNSAALLLHTPPPEHC